MYAKRRITCIYEHSCDIISVNNVTADIIKFGTYMSYTISESENILESDYYKHEVREYDTNDSHNNTDCCHLFSVDDTSRMSKCIRRSRDRKDHCK